MLAAAVAAPPLAADEEGSKLAAILRDIGPSIVTVKVVTTTTLQMGSASRDQEARLSLPGVVVGSGGLIMTSNLAFAPERLMRYYRMGDGEDGPKFKTVAGEIEVTFESDDKENRAFLAATDSNLGLAFLQIEDLGGRKIKAVDFNRAATPELGEVVAAVSRLPKSYDSAPYFETARIGGEVVKPRRGWMIDHGLSPLGLPVFSTSGKVVGIVAIAEADNLADSEGDAMFSAATRMLTGGGGMTRPFIVPAMAVAGVVDQARQQAEKMLADRAAAKKTAPAAP
jgi:hypothetical protein